MTWFTRYRFPEELLYHSAKPFLTLPLDSYFVRTQSTEAYTTYFATSPIACSYFVFPFISHQIWSFFLPIATISQRTTYLRFLLFSGSSFSFFLFLTPPRAVPNVWHFPYCVGATSHYSPLMIKLQPKIYDHLLFTVRISFIPSVCSQVPVIVFRLPAPRGLSLDLTNKRPFWMVFPLLTASLSTPPDVLFQIPVYFSLRYSSLPCLLHRLYNFVNWRMLFHRELIT